MKKILGMVLVMFIFQLSAAFFPNVAHVQSYAGEEKTSVDINSLKKELEEEKEGLIGLKDEFEFIVEQEKETLENIAYINALIKEAESASQEGTKTKGDVKAELDALKEELGMEEVTLGEIRDEVEAFRELEKETEGIIADITAKIKKAESTTVVAVAEAPQQKSADTSESSAVSAGKSKLTKKEELQKQLLAVKGDLDDEIELLDETEEEIEIMYEEIEEMKEQKEEIEEGILATLDYIKELESSIAAIEAKEKAQPSTETKPPAASSGKE